MSQSDAQAIVGLVWRGEREEDAAFVQALTVLGMSRLIFNRFARAAKRVERKFSRRLVLIPTGGKQH